MHLEWTKLFCIYSAQEATFIRPHIPQVEVVGQIVIALNTYKNKLSPDKMTNFHLLRDRLWVRGYGAAENVSE